MRAYYICLANCTVSPIVQVRVYCSSLKKKNSKQTTALETHFYIIKLFFLSLDFPYEYKKSFPDIFYYAPVRIFTIMNA